jgi:hypothetical protein
LTQLLARLAAAKLQELPFRMTLPQQFLMAQL